SRFGWGTRVPLLTRILPGGGPGDSSTEGSFITGLPDNIVIISAIPSASGDASTIHIRETAGRQTVFKPVNGMTGRPFRVTETDLAGKPAGRQAAVNQAIIGPLESKFFRIELTER